MVMVMLMVVVMTVIVVVMVVVVIAMLVRMGVVEPLFCQLPHWLPPFAPLLDP